MVRRWRSRSRAHASALLAGLLVWGTAAGAQPGTPDVDARGVPRVVAAPRRTTPIGLASGMASRVQDAKRAPWWAPVASALVPGAGQLALGQQRAAAYFVADAYLVAQAISAQRAGNSDRLQYRQIAANVARAQFTPSPPVGRWAYYELLETGRESGVFTRTAGRVDPETDVTTVNGATWLKARQINWTDPDVAPAVNSPEYARALAFYEANAVRDDFRWSWRDAGIQWDEYRQAVKESNRNYKRAVTVVGLVGANHLASLIDAYVTVRIRRFGGAGVDVAGLHLEGMETSVRPALIDPRSGQVAPQLHSSLRLSFGGTR